MTKKLLIIMVVIATSFASCKSSQQRTKIVMETTAGVVEMELYDETPIHRDNFIKLANEGYFDSLLFHRVIPNFMIQGGDPNSKNAEKGQRLGDGGPGYTLEAEFRIPQFFHKRGVLAAAREGDGINPEKRSSPSQFYIVSGEVYSKTDLENMQKMMQARYGDSKKLTDEQIEAYTTIGGTPFLDGEYTVFGEVTKGYETVEKIQAVSCDKYDRPNDDIRILKVKIKK